MEKILIRSTGSFKQTLPDEWKYKAGLYLTDQEKSRLVGKVSLHVACELLKGRDQKK